MYNWSNYHDAELPVERTRVGQNLRGTYAKLLMHLEFARFFLKVSYLIFQTKMADISSYAVVF